MRRPGGRPSSSRLRIIDPLVQTERSSRPRPGVYGCLTGGDLQRGPARPLGAPHRAGSSVTRNSRAGSRHTSMHWWVSCGMIPASLIKVAQHVNQRRMRGAAGHFFGSIRISQPIFRAVPGFLWVILMGKGSVEARGKRAAFSKPRWARSVRPRGRQLPQGPSVSDKMALTEGSHARCRTGPPRPRTGVEPCHDPVHAESADLCRPNAQFPPERQRYEALTPFGKSGYSHFFHRKVVS